VHSAKARLLDINPHIQINIYETPLSSTNAKEIVAPYDIVVDGTDNFPTRYLVNDVCVLLGKPNVYGSIFKFDGQASVFNHTGCWVRPEGWDSLSKEERKEFRKRKADWIYDEKAKGPNYRDLYPEPPPPGLVPSCAEGGVLGVLPGIIGCIQANEVVKIILGIGRTLSGRMLSYDALTMSFREFKLQPNPNTPPITELIDYQQFCGILGDDSDMVEHFTRLSPTEVKTKLDSGWNPIWIDVRKPHEIDIVSLDRVDFVKAHEDILEILPELSSGRDVLVMCKAGGRSAKACLALAEAGVDNLYNLDGGITGWAAEIDPSLATY
jgi:adenylyltransferase/sulfurtransferase